MNYDPEVMPEDLKEDKIMARGFRAVDLIVTAGAVMLAFFTEKLVASQLRWVYIIGTGAITFFFTRPSKALNPRKTILNSIIYMLMRPSETYESIAVEEETIDVEELS